MRSARAVVSSLRTAGASRIAKRLLGVLAATAPTVARLKCSLPAPGGPPIVHVVGDSHVCFFSGIEPIAHPWPEPSEDRIGLFRTHWLGPATAYNLPDLGTTVRAREKLLSVLAYGPVEPRGLVMLSFGEIDCRFHLLKQAETQRREVDELVRECVQRYSGVAREIQGFGFRPLVWNVVPSGQPRTSEETHSEFPHWGTVEERNAVTRLFNDECAAALAASGIPFVSIFDDLLGPDGLPLRDAYYMDAVHLSQKAMPLAEAAVLDALRHMNVDGM